MHLKKKDYFDQGMRFMISVTIHPDVSELNLLSRRPDKMQKCLESVESLYYSVKLIITWLVPSFTNMLKIADLVKKGEILCKIQSLEYTRILNSTFRFILRNTLNIVLSVLLSFTTFNVPIRLLAKNYNLRSFNFLTEFTAK